MVDVLLYKNEYRIKSVEITLKVSKKEGRYLWKLSFKIDRAIKI
jgi:hypothetical protein